MAAGCRRTGFATCSKFKLTEMYAGVPVVAEDFIHACAWFLLATRSSCGIHRHRARSGYERISVRLTPAQLARAKRLAGDWQPKKPNKTAPVRSPKLS